MIKWLGGKNPSDLGFKIGDRKRALVYSAYVECTACTVNNQFLQVNIYTLSVWQYRCSVASSRHQPVTQIGELTQTGKREIIKNINQKFIKKKKKKVFFFKDKEISDNAEIC